MSIKSCISLVTYLIFTNILYFNVILQDQCWKNIDSCGPFDTGEGFLVEYRNGPVVVAEKSNK
jgi:hypothetical protein